jgi:hypothetical protein
MNRRVPSTTPGINRGRRLRTFSFDVAKGFDEGITGYRTQYQRLQIAETVARIEYYILECGAADHV